MTNAQRQAVELTLRHPDWTDAKIAQELDKTPAWLCNLKKKQEYKDYLKERMTEIWSEAGIEARKVMIDLLSDAKSEVAYKASQFILQSLYPEMTPTNRIEADVNSNIIKVTVEEE